MDVSNTPFRQVEHVSTSQWGAPGGQYDRSHYRIRSRASGARLRVAEFSVFATLATSIALKLSIQHELVQLKHDFRVPLILIF